MGKVLALLFIILLALVSVACYLFLTEKIIVGDRQIADGQRQLDKEQSELKEGKAKLEAGKRESSEGKKDYEQAKDNLFLVLADKLLKGGKGFKEDRERIAEGNKQIAKGEDKVNVGERRLDAGKLELRRGREQLRLAKGLFASMDMSVPWTYIVLNDQGDLTIEVGQDRVMSLLIRPGQYQFIALNVEEVAAEIELRAAQVIDERKERKAVAVGE